MLFDLLLGVVLFAIVGPIWHIPSLQIAGAILAAIGLALYVFFGRLAARRGAGRAVSDPRIPSVIPAKAGIQGAVRRADSASRE